MWKEQLTINTALRTIDKIREFIFGVKGQMSKVKCTLPHSSASSSRQSASSLGFTLVEMTVSLGLFTIIMFIATSAFLSIVNTDRKSRSVRIAADNLNITLEDMSRRIKTGSEYDCGVIGEETDCPSGESSFNFLDQDSATTTYRLDTISNAIFRKIGTGTDLQITSSEITIDSLEFVVSGSTPCGATPPCADTEQPMVVIVIDGSLGTGATESGFKIQTTVTQRAYDNQ